MQIVFIIIFEISTFNFFILISFIKIFDWNKGIFTDFEVIFCISIPNIKLFGTQIDSIPLLISKCFNKISSVVITSFIIFKYLSSIFKISGGYKVPAPVVINKL